MNGNPQQYLERLYAGITPKYAFAAANEQEWARWRETLRAVVAETLGRFPEHKTELQPDLIEETDMGDHIRQRVVFESDRDLQVPTYILVPKNAKGKLPAVIACHGHGYGSRAVVGLRADGTPNADDPDYHNNFAVELVRRGFLVAAPELLGFGDRRLADVGYNSPNENSCHPIAAQLLMMGRTIAGARVYDIFRTIDYLQSRADADGERIGCMGISGGGLVAAFASALDDRIKVAAISGYVNTFKDSIMSIRHCIDNYIPNMLLHAEMPDIVGLIAPKPLLVESGTADRIFPVGAAKEAVSKIARIYGLLGENDKLGHDVFEGKHQISGNMAYDWFVKWL
ncbi:alpha/beta hydrolase family protein [Paenibacillus sp. GYB003]|uniref:alpha/beta hydrolase family protein n=1 Tax=Paenibacillus sp. GYB003 TaxID=2994392 RepID=UPI002F9655EA